MKNLICAAIALSLLLPAVASARPGDTGFVVTSRKYNERENYAAICHEEFGIHARVADFADIRDLIRRDPYMRDFIEDTGLQAFKSSALLHFRGQKWGPRGEPYYIQKRDHKRSRRTEGIIDQIGDGLFELKVRKNNAKPIMCFIPHEHRREAPRVRLPLTPPPPPVLREPPPPPPPPPPPARDPRLLSTKRMYREHHFLNDKCRAEFGPGARVADWEDIQRYVRSGRDFEQFLRENDIHRGNRDRLVYYRGQYKDHRDRHFYLIYNEKGLTPSAVTPIDRAHGNRLNLAGMMHLRSPILCLVP